MQFYYGEKNLFRALDEAEFWKHQEVEHTVVISLITPNLEQKYAMKLKQSSQEFHKIHAETIKYIESITRSNGSFGRELRNQIVNFIRQCIEQSQQFIEFLEEMLQNSEAVKSNMSSQTVIHHIIRESQYFIGIDQLILY